MKRDMDLIRSLLLEIEEKDDGSFNWVEIDLPDYAQAQIVEHLFLLAEAGLIEVIDTSTMKGRDFKARRLTTLGHDYLDTIRDPEIWRKTKEGAAAAGGFTVELLGEIALGFVKTKVKQHTGIDV